MVPIDYFDSAAEEYPDRIAIVDGGVVLTFRDVQRISHQLASWIVGPSPGAGIPIVAIYSPNDYRVLIAAIAVMRAGGVVVPVHAANPVHVTQSLFDTVKPTHVFFHSGVSRQVESLQESTRATTWVCIDTTSAGASTLWDVGEVGAYCRSDWIEASGNHDRPVYYWSTSGTTGEPKIVIDDVVSFEGALKLVRELNAGDATAIPRTLAVAPLSHGAGPHSIAVLTLGGMVVVVRQFDAAAVLTAIEVHGISDIWLPPTALYLLLESADIRRRNLSSLRHVWVSTMAIAPAKLKEAVEILGPCISQMYGQIESGFVTALDAAATAAAAAGDHPERLVSAGRTLFVNRIAIMDEAGTILPPEGRGEIVVRGTCVKRYWGEPETREARRFGWHHTGDLGYFDKDGFLYIVGRIRDVVNMAGIKIPCPQLEAAILELAEVRDAAVFPIPDGLRGEVPKAVIVLNEGCDLSADTIVAHCRTRLGAQRVPVSIEVWPSLPLSPAGKVDKGRLRAMLAMPDGGRTLQ